MIDNFFFLLYFDEMRLYLASKLPNENIYELESRIKSITEDEEKYDVNIKSHQCVIRQKLLTIYEYL